MNDQKPVVQKPLNHRRKVGGGGGHDRILADGLGLWSNPAHALFQESLDLFPDVPDEGVKVLVQFVPIAVGPA